MTVDVEDYFQVSALEAVCPRSSWSSSDYRVKNNVYRILELFESHDVKATFFTLGCIAEEYPGMIREMVEAGHEIASHGWDHVRVSQQQPEEFRQDVTRTRKLLEDTSGAAVTGYRAASYSINEENLWALDILAESGYLYSSSIVPVKHDLYGMPEAPRFAFDAAGGALREIPITTVTIAGKNINCAGGGWFRLFPYAFSRWALRQVNEQENESAVFYFHPWEIDPQQPRFKNLALKSRFRHYLNLEKMQPRLERLLGDFQWARMDQVFMDADK
ncbi:DUF3473 domain-containing protein [Halieaceae bacterium IMCC14734]|uniref:DUF3473 domain-containing protein n=1 Tax=Candidatus Litorirhabdus singularis TaxID=2518993 RepID=A0ABT3TH06_9GAMM|nr:XrtA system polysaccharide deacetylase [Candidatus Litorirhabdus singularis]MCX2981289.1 DUF3473 domain-containing protein [Candidatus Litorirhabdus singularis]